MVHSCAMQDSGVTCLIFISPAPLQVPNSSSKIKVWADSKILLPLAPFRQQPLREA